MKTPQKGGKKGEGKQKKKSQHTVSSTTLLNQQGADPQMAPTASTAQVNEVMSHDTTQLHYLLSSV